MKSENTGYIIEKDVSRIFFGNKNHYFDDQLDIAEAVYGMQIKIFFYIIIKNYDKIKRKEKEHRSREK